jgi:hypothetical protein
MLNQRVVFGWEHHKDEAYYRRNNKSQINVAVHAFLFFQKMPYPAIIYTQLYMGQVPQRERERGQEGEKFRRSKCLARSICLFFLNAIPCLSCPLAIRVRILFISFEFENI